MPVIPAFNRDGLLPPGDYVATLDELRRSMLVKGSGPSRSSWDAA
jgi:hypothetical protein